MSNRNNLARGNSPGGNALEENLSVNNVNNANNNLSKLGNLNITLTGKNFVGNKQNMASAGELEEVIEAGEGQSGAPGSTNLFNGLTVKNQSIRENVSPLTNLSLSSASLARAGTTEGAQFRKEVSGFLVVNGDEAILQVKTTGGDALKATICGESGYTTNNPSSRVSYNGFGGTPNINTSGKSYSPPKTIKFSFKDLDLMKFFRDRNGNTNDNPYVALTNGDWTKIEKKKDSITGTPLGPAIAFGAYLIKNGIAIGQFTMRYVTLAKLFTSSKNPDLISIGKKISEIENYVKVLMNEVANQQKERSSKKSIYDNTNNKERVIFDLKSFEKKIKAKEEEMKPHINVLLKEVKDLLEKIKEDSSAKTIVQEVTNAVEEGKKATIAELANVTNTSNLKNKPNNSKNNNPKNEGGAPEMLPEMKQLLDMFILVLHGAASNEIVDSETSETMSNKTRIVDKDVRRYIDAVAKYQATRSLPTKLIKELGDSDAADVQVKLLKALQAIRPFLASLTEGWTAPSFSSMFSRGKTQKNIPRKNSNSYNELTSYQPSAPPEALGALEDEENEPKNYTQQNAVKPLTYFNRIKKFGSSIASRFTRKNPTAPASSMRGKPNGSGTPFTTPTNSSYYPNNVNSNIRNLPNNKFRSKYNKTNVFRKNNPMLNKTRKNTRYGSVGSSNRINPRVQGSLGQYVAPGIGKRPVGASL